MPPIQGVYAAALTPRRLGMQDVNLGVMWELVDFLGEKKVNGMEVFGSTGEFVHYSPSERMRLMGLAPKRSRVPVLINVSHSTLDGAVELAQAAMASGAAGVLLMPPYFYRYDEDGIRDFYSQFAEEADLRIPVLLYNSTLSTNPVRAELAESLLRDGTVQGIKDSTGDWAAISHLIQVRSTLEFTLMIGNDSLFARARQGSSAGLISGIACAIPELLVALEAAVSRGAVEMTSKLQARIEEFTTWIDRLPSPVGIKVAAAERGFKLGPHAVPLSDRQERLTAEFREWFGGWLPIILSETRHA